MIGLLQWRDEPEVQRYRSVAAILNYLAPDRPNVQYAVKEVCRNMSAPRLSDWAKLKRFVRYLVGRPRLITKMDYQYRVVEFKVCSDSNWVGCRTTQKPTSGGCLYFGSHCITFWSKTQHNITISGAEAEAEAVAVVKTVSEAFANQRLCPEFGANFKMNVYIDAQAAKGILEREGVVKIRHIDVGVLWLQQRHLRSQLEFAKVNGSVNPADLMTKGLGRDKIKQFLRDIGGVL